jgi:hypothetical protein
LFLGFRIGAVRGCDFAVLPVNGQRGFYFKNFYFNCRIRSCRNCRSGSCWVSVSAFS